MINLQKLRSTKHKILAIGSHPNILQSIMDFDYLAGKSEPSLEGIIGTGRKYERYFWGKRDVLVPVYPSLQSIPAETKSKITLFVNLTSGRRILSTTVEAMTQLPHLMAGSVFAENAPELHSIELYHESQKRDISLIGPATIGLLIPGKIKLGAIGGVSFSQLIDSRVFEKGGAAVLCSSGGMTNELIRMLSHMNIALSFALSFGGDLFPLTTPKEAFLAAHADPDTTHIVYFGELGGYDEYELVELIKSGQVKKPVVAYIAGSVSSVFETPPQFGHAKAMAQKGEETAEAKGQALRAVGVKVGTSYAEFVQYVRDSVPANMKDDTTKHDDLGARTHALFTSTITADHDGVPTVLGTDLVVAAQKDSLSAMISDLLLGKKHKSKELSEFTELVFKLLVDHGPYVSGAVNTMITARAGKDLVSSLCAGLLTIGPRFGGAVNEAAGHWLAGVENGNSANTFVEAHAAKRKLISGIGHKKYSSRNPDPRVTALMKFADKLKDKKHLTFALSVEKITTAKKANLILNVDGAIAALLLDILVEYEGFTKAELTELVRIEFFNAYFVLARSIGFTAHYLDQRRLDEGLFRLPHNMVADKA